MNELNQLMMAERSVFADMGGGGELAQDLGKIIERAQQAAYPSVDVILGCRNWFIFQDVLNFRHSVSKIRNRLCHPSEVELKAEIEARKQYFVEQHVK